VLTFAALVTAIRVWPAEDTESLPHSHDGLPADHPHLAEADGHRHDHAFVIDDLHSRWPSRAD
jgi:hypothetical protein